MKHNLRPCAASLLLISSLALATALVVCLPGSVAAESSGSKREAARTQFERAQKLRAALEAKPEQQRTEADYKRVVTAFRRVYLITPHSGDVPAALLAVAELEREMGRLYGEKHYQTAVDAYQFLLHEYPGSRRREEALLAIGQIQKDELDQPALAQKTFEEFLKRHPRSNHASEARAALAELAKERREDEEPVARRSRPEPKKQSGGIPRVTQIRAWNADTFTRIVIDLDGEVEYRAARIADPDRIYFDIHKAKLSSALARAPIEVPSGLLKSIRVAQNQAGVVRVVLEVEKAQDFKAYVLPEPYRLVVDVYGSQMTAKRVAPGENPKPAAPSKVEVATTVARVNPEKVESLREAKTGPKPVRAEEETRKPRRTETAEENEKAGATAGKAEEVPGGKIGRPRAASPPSKAGAKVAGGETAVSKPPSVPKPTLNGQPSLTRALGLKVGRIVIDPGHGGHDTGTIGPSGLMEKDLCLDLGLRLGKLIRQRLPSAEVVYTREDDTYVPLEERTAIANRNKADLFLSIHANSSRNPKARGIETYYLNFNSSPEAMEVAARENAMAQETVHDLQELVKKIARNEKIEESREFASNVQDALSKRLQRAQRSMKNRGVRKAPFVVLIGANMPSVLAEVSFLSNPADEQLLKKPDHRQRVAEGLYRGVENYLQSVNSLTFNLSNSSPESRAAGLASAGNQK